MMLCPSVVRVSRPFDAMSTSRVTPSDAFLSHAYHYVLRTPSGAARCER